MTDLLIKRIAELHIINRTDTNQSVSITNINLIETLLITLVFDKKKEIEKFVEHLRQKGGLNYNLDLRIWLDVLNGIRKRNYNLPPYE